MQSPLSCETLDDCLIGTSAGVVESSRLRLRKLRVPVQAVTQTRHESVAEESAGGPSGSANKLGADSDRGFAHELIRDSGSRSESLHSEAAHSISDRSEAQREPKETPVKLAPGLTLELFPLSGAGNRFLVLDLWDGAELAGLPAEARRLCSASLAGKHPDGLLCLARSDSGAGLRMILFNADGSRAGACGNGLRCIAWLAQVLGRISSAGGVIQTDAGNRRVRCSAAEAWAEVEIGPAQWLETGRAWIVDTPTQIWHRLDLGNPHVCTRFDEDPERAPLEQWGPALQRQESFRDGVNVGVWHWTGEVLQLRVWERGVGETDACGTGACAAASCAVREGLCDWPVRVQLRGGELIVHEDDGGSLMLRGPVESWG
ncbi:MAG: diaminopimelate epimerase [Planctomycetota bacterium]